MNRHIYSHGFSGILLALFLLFTIPSFGKLTTPVIFKPVNNTVDAPTGLQLEVNTENSSTIYAFEYAQDASMKNATRVEVLRTSYYTRTGLNKLKFNTTYYWRVKAISKTDSSDWTSINNFKTTAILKRYYPVQNTKVNSSFLYLSCYRASGIDSFELQIDTSKQFNSKAIRSVVIPDTFKSFS